MTGSGNGEPFVEDSLLSPAPEVSTDGWIAFDTNMTMRFIQTGMYYSCATWVDGMTLRRFLISVGGYLYPAETSEGAVCVDGAIWFNPNEWRRL